mgnify:CR=1 FL=1
MAAVANNCYRLLEYIEDGQSDSRLEALIAEYVKPVVIKDSIGEFTLNRAIHGLREVWILREAGLA